MGFRRFRDVVDVGYCTGRSKQAYTLRQMVVDVWWNPF